MWPLFAVDAFSCKSGFGGDCFLVLVVAGDRFLGLLLSPTYPPLFIDRISE